MTYTQRVGVYGFILNQHSHALILRRAMHDSHPGSWELPGGGVDPGETPEEAVLREMKEEAGLATTVHLPFCVLLHTEENKQVFRIVYLCTMVHGAEEVRLSEEHDAYQWIPLEREQFAKTSSHFLAKVYTDYAELVKQNKNS